MTMKRMTRYFTKGHQPSSTGRLESHPYVTIVPKSVNGRAYAILFGRSLSIALSLDISFSGLISEQTR